MLFHLQITIAKQRQLCFSLLALVAHTTQYLRVMVGLWLLWLLLEYTDPLLWVLVFRIKEFKHGSERKWRVIFSEFKGRTIGLLRWRSWQLLEGGNREGGGNYAPELEVKKVGRLCDGRLGTVNCAVGLWKVSGKRKCLMSGQTGTCFWLVFEKEDEREKGKSDTFWAWTQKADMFSSEGLLIAALRKLLWYSCMSSIQRTSCSL